MPLRSNLGKVLHKELSDRTRHTGTHGSWTNLINGKADLILVCRKPSPDEWAHARENNVEFDIRPVALDAFVFLVNAENNVENLSVQQIREIYSGRITDWSQVGGDPPGPDDIHPYQRNSNSGSQVTMARLVMRGLDMVEAASMVQTGMGGPYSVLDHEERGMGYTFYYYHRYMQPNPKVKIISVGGVKPGATTITSRLYPYTTEVYVVSRKGLKANSPAAKVRDWLLSQEGQKIVAESGYVPIGKGATASGLGVPVGAGLLFCVRETRLDAEGRLYFGHKNEQCADAEFAEHLKKVAPYEDEFILYADRAVPFERLAQVVNMLRKAGIPNFKLKVTEADR
ncbi:MAG: substrate-binding domain-containing protein [Phycisphaerae bacterium]|nr:substrate-binding domain-containing protein [Phycisphaerae bacterium]